MAEIQTGEFSRWRSNLVDAHRLLKVAVWDCGPEQPRRPAKLVPPKVAPGTIEADLAAIEAHSILENYEVQLKRYLAARAEFEQWHARHSGPVIIEQWSCDARDTFAHDGRAVAEGRQRARRYYRYDPKAQRQGLPVGVEPGRSHAEQVERQVAADQALEVVKADDPQFGSQR